MITKSEMGKKSRQAGARFELKVRKDLESKGWIVDKWTNNVELILNIPEGTTGKLVKAKNKFRGKKIPMMLGSGFPDFICFPEIWDERDFYLGETMAHCGSQIHQTIIGVEVKSEGYLSREEKEKCKWLLDNHKFSKIFIGKKSKQRGKIIYKEFKNE